MTAALIIPCIFFAVGPLVASLSVWHACRTQSRTRVWLAVPAAMLFAVGWMSFMAGAVSAGGGFDWLPRTFEWPVGWAKGVVRTSDGGYAVPHEGAGRVQLYDEQLHFRRGWQTQAHGGGFTLTALTNGGVQVRTARDSQTYSYDTAGELLPAGVFAKVLSSAASPESVPDWFPPPWWGWTLTTPVIAWVTGAVGLCLLAALARARVTPHHSRAVAVRE